MADYQMVIPLFVLTVAAAAPILSDDPRTYLASIEGISLGSFESIDEFEIETWGVDFKAVCHIPAGWWIEAGSSATPEGSLKGRGSLGATWLGQDRLGELHDLVLITLYGPVQREDERNMGGNAVVPATFKGEASVYGLRPRKVSLTHANVKLVPAKRCPS